MLQARQALGISLSILKEIVLGMLGVPTKRYSLTRVYAQYIPASLVPVGSTQGRAAGVAVY
jgi:hypothetical protein